jgi:Na+-translocating ferredoxin:NAD+ oxidoreductase RnfD subunit
VTGGSTGRRGLFARLAGVSPPWLFSSLLTLIVVVGELFFHTLGGFERLVAALGTSIVAEHVVARLFSGRKGNTLSAYITGNSILVLTKPGPGLLWPFVMGPIVAIMSKVALTYRGRHIWNPTNLSFSLLLLLAPDSVSILSHQWGNDLRVVGVIFLLGFLVVGKSHLLHISGTYVVSFVVLALVRSGINGQPMLAELAPITGPMYMLFLFFMLTDPKTVVSSRNGRILVVIIIALAEMLIRLSAEWNIGFLQPLLTAPPIFALAIVGPIAKVIDIRRTG